MLYYYDYTYTLIIIGFLISLIASSNVKSTFNKYSKIRNMQGLTGRECAERILNQAGIYDVSVQRIKGNLTDHYSPNEKVLRLSDGVYDSMSVAALGVAAHECGHAIQHQQSYSPLIIRNSAVKITNIGSMLSWPVLILGVLLGNEYLATLGAYLFLGVVFFQLITLPVEFNASKRAVNILENNMYLSGNEIVGAKKVLKAAALTYVMALVNSLLQLLRLLMIANRAKRR